MSMDQETFKKEMDMCRRLSQENGGGCSWGKCKDCGVVLLLYKLGRNEFFEDKTKIDAVKKENGIITI